MLTQITTAGVMIFAIFLATADSSVEFRTAGLKAATFWQALKSCTDLGEQWTLPRADLASEVLQRVMSSKNLSSAWMGIERKVGPWTWVNETRSSKFTTAASGYNCAALDVNEQKLMAAPCAGQSFGFLCELPAGKDCPFMLFKQACLTLGETRGILACRSKNWFEARSFCLEAGGDLSVLDRRQREAVSKLVADRRIIADCPYVYVGLHRESWLDRHTREGSKILNKHHWTINEPKDANCAEVNREGTWMAKPCDSTSAVLCQNYQTQTKTETKGRNTWFIIALAAIVAAAIFAVTVAILAILLHLSRKSKYLPVNTQELSTMENLKLPDVLRKEDCITLIIFNYQLSKDKDEFRGDQKLKENNTWIGPWDDKPLEKTVKDIPFRILHINTAVPVLSKSQSERVLNYLESERENIDIVYLPGMELNEASVSLVQKLRQSVALFCFAKKDCTGNTSAETITIGFTGTEYKRRHPDIIANGLLDVTCNTPEKDLDDSIDPRMAHTLVMAASRMWMQKLDKQNISNVTAEMRQYLIDIAKKEGSASRIGHHPYRGFGELPLEDPGTTPVAQDASDQSESEPASDEETSKRVQGKKLNKIVIAMGSTGVDTTNPALKNWDIKPFEESRTKDEDTAYYTGTSVAELLTSSLKQFGLSSSEVEIYDVHLLKDAWKDDWPHFEQLLNRLKEKKPDIVYFASGLGYPENDSPIPQLIHDVKQQSVFLTSSVLKDPSEDVYADFPSDSVISVRVDKNPHSAPPRIKRYARGATVDFVMKGPPSIHNERVWNGGVRATALVAKILVQAESLAEVSISRQKQLRKTDVMHHVLLQLCEGHKSHDNVEIIQDEVSMKKRIDNAPILLQYINTACSAKKYWAGKTLR